MSTAPARSARHPLRARTALSSRLPQLLAVLALAGAAAAQRTWLGADTRGVELDAAQRALAAAAYPEARAGVLVEHVFAGYPAWRSGLRDGDVLVALDGALLGATPAEAQAAFVARAERSAPGARWETALLRDALHVAGERDGEPLADPLAVLAEPERALAGAPDGTRIVLELERGLRLVIEPFVLAGPPPRSERAMPNELFDGALFARHDLAREVEGWIDQHGLRADADDLFARLARLSRTGDRSRLDAVNLGLREPWRLRGLVEAVAEGFETRALGKRPERWIARLAGALAVPADATTSFAKSTRSEPETLPRGLDAEGHLDRLAALLAEAHALREGALADLSAAEREHLAAHWHAVGERLEPALYLYTDPDAARRAQNERTVALAERVERGAMLAAAARLGGLCDPERLAALAADLERDGADLSAPIVARRDTPHGAIVIAGRGPNVHREGGAAILLDLGGDDVYGADMASTVDASLEVVRSVAVLVDVAGDDAYESTHDGAQGCGVLGVGLLCDLAGDDSYVGLRWAQGVGFAGVGLLLDAAGDDSYRSHGFAQGLGIWGAGALADLAGDDRYESHVFAQAVGMPGGVGVLVEREGRDEYWCKGTHPTGYGTAGVFEGWGQGCGVGFRLNASGGFALLLDEGGRDRYEAGNFAQGGGYYYGLGALCDRGKDDDRYVGSRYDQGFAAHQACGYFRDSGGDDVYLTRNAVAQGLAWDKSVTVFLDDSGDDVYQGGGFSLGASAHNAFSVFLDRRGRDTYLRDGFARAGPNDYHGGTSLSVFVDAGGDADHWPGTDRNGTVEVGGAHGIFVDR